MHKFKVGEFVELKTLEEVTAIEHNSYFNDFVKRYEISQFLGTVIEIIALIPINGYRCNCGDFVYPEPWIRVPLKLKLEMLDEENKNV